MAKMANTQDSSVVYDEVSRCVIYFADGAKKVTVNPQEDCMLAVKVVSYSNDNPSFAEMVFKNYKPSFTVEELADSCGYYSVKTFTRHFKKAFNTTPKQWMLTMRKDKMLVYLKNTKQTLREVAANLGFANVAHLSDFCLKRTGMRPEDIRRAEIEG